jgi:hypothetical protein
MVLKIFILWIALGVLALVFNYCCSLVSNGPRRELEDDDLAAEAPRLAAPRSGEPRLGDPYGA